MVNFGIIGCGRISDRHLNAICKNGLDAKLVAVSDLDESKARRVAEDYNCDFYINYHELLQRPDIDIVDLCTPNGTHLEFALDIAAAKKHLLTEKPMDITYERAEKMIKACKENNVRLFVVKQNRYNPPILKLREALERGRFGKLILGNVTVRWSRPQEYYQDGWHGTKAIDGGTLYTQASHHIDMLQWMLGPVDSVQCYAATLGHKIETDDTAVATLKFKDGALGLVEATTCTFPRNLEGSVTILGEKGTVKIGGMAMNKVEFWEFKDYKNEDEIVREISVTPPNVYGFSHIEVIRNVVDVLNNVNSKLLCIDGYEGIKSIKIIEAMYESARLGKEVKLK